MSSSKSEKIIDANFLLNNRTPVSDSLNKEQLEERVTINYYNWKKEDILKYGGKILNFDVAYIQSSIFDDVQDPDKRWTLKNVGGEASFYEFESGKHTVHQENAMNYLSSQLMISFSPTTSADLNDNGRLSDDVIWRFGGARKLEGDGGLAYDPTANGKGANSGQEAKYGTPINLTG